VFEPSKPGRHYGPGARAGCLGVKFLEYSLAGIVCGFIGQGIANQLMHLKCGISSHSSFELQLQLETRWPQLMRLWAALPFHRPAAADPIP